VTSSVSGNPGRWLDIADHGPAAVRFVNSKSLHGWLMPSDSSDWLPDWLPQHQKLPGRAAAATDADPTALRISPFCTATWPSTHPFWPWSRPAEGCWSARRDTGPSSARWQPSCSSGVRWPGRCGAARRSLRWSPLSPGPVRCWLPNRRVCQDYRWEPTTVTSGPYRPAMSVLTAPAAQVQPAEPALTSSRAALRSRTQRPPRRG